MHLPFAPSPQWRHPGNAAYGLGTTATIALLNPLLGALFLFLLIAGGASPVQREQQAARGDNEPVPPEPAPLSDADKKRVTAALKVAGP